MKRTSIRTLCICATVGVILGLSSLYAIMSFKNITARHETQMKNFRTALVQYEETIGFAHKLAESATTIEDWEKVRALANTLPSDSKAHFVELATIGMLEAVGYERDRLLRNAGELYTANSRDPGVLENINKARELQKRADALLTTLESEGKSSEWNLALQYRKAYEKYRSLAFIEKNENDKALDILDDAVKNLQAANELRKKDIDVEYALEFLYERAQNEERQRGSKGEAGLDRPRSLPPRGPQDPGAGGRDRPRRH